MAKILVSIVLLHLFSQLKINARIILNFGKPVAHSALIERVIRSTNVKDIALIQYKSQESYLRSPIGIPVSYFFITDENRSKFPKRYNIYNRSLFKFGTVE